MNLTKRQTQIIELMAQGNTAEQVAEAINRSVATVRRHVVLACERVEARNITHLVAKAISQGWIKTLCVTLAFSVVMDNGLNDKMRNPMQPRTQRIQLTRTVRS